MAARGPNAAPIKPEQMFADMQPWIFGMAVVGLIASVIFIALIAAAVVRRLHDRELSGWWAVPVLALNAISQIIERVDDRERQADREARSSAPVRRDDADFQLVVAARVGGGDRVRGRARVAPAHAARTATVRIHLSRDQATRFPSAATAPTSRSHVTSQARHVRQEEDRRREPARAVRLCDRHDVRGRDRADRAPR